MELSNRLKFIVHHIKDCSNIADIGTDHGYIPIYTVKTGICKSAIATDINRDPVKKARINVDCEGLSDKIQVRLGGGFKPIVRNEVEASVIAGMGGNLIRDILEEDMDITKSFKFLILQPAQNPEVLREYLYKNNYEIICEDLCLDEGIYYELFKVRKSKNIENEDVESIYYEIPKKLIEEKHTLMSGYLQSKYDKYTKILGFIKDDTESAKFRKEELLNKIKLIKIFMEEIQNEG